MGHVDHAPLLGAASGIATLDGSSKVVQHSAFEGVASGVATLDGSTKLSAAQIPTTVELNTNKGAASGYASLDGSTKVPDAQIPASVERTANKGAASGYASLDGSTKVPDAQIPASVERTANKDQANGYAGLDSFGFLLDAEIPGSIERSTNKGAANGYPSLDANTLIPLAQLPPQVPQWVKITKTQADFTASATNESIDLYSLPAGYCIHSTKIKHTTPFTGGTISAWTFKVGVTGDFTKYLGASSGNNPAPFDAFQAAGNTAFAISGYVGSENHGAATNIKLTADSTGDDVVNATAGSVDVWLLISKAT